MRIKLALLLCCLLIHPVFAQDETPTPVATDAPPEVLTIWLPDALIAPENADALAVMDEQIQAFIESETNVEVQTRLRRVGGVGGIMSTLQSATMVAPDALPDITLMRRQDVVTATRDGLIDTLEGDISSQVIGSLDNALRLGQIDEELYALPYLLELQHVVYRPQDDIDYSDWAYEDVIERGDIPVFTASRVAGLNNVFYMQYVAAGGTLTREGVLGLNRSALQNTFAFYEQTFSDELIDTNILNYSSSLDYQADFVAGNINSAVFSSSIYLGLLDDDRDLKAAPVPTIDGQQISILNGWSWVLISAEGTQRDLSLRFMEGMMDGTQQLEFAETVNMLPSRRENLEAALPAVVDEMLYTTLLDNAILPLTESEGGTLARAIQTAFTGILSGTLTADEATESIEEQEGT